MVTTAVSDRLNPSGSPVWLGNTKHNRGGPENKNSFCTECFHGAWRYSVTHVLGKHCSCTIHSRLERSGVLRVGGGLGREGGRRLVCSVVFGERSQVQLPGCYTKSVTMTS